MKRERCISKGRLLIPPLAHALQASSGQSIEERDKALKDREAEVERRDAEFREQVTPA